MKNAFCLGMGVFITLVFLLFPSWIFEAGYYETEFSNEMYNENLYLVVAVITAAVAWGGAALFYYVVNSVSFSRWYHWLLTLGVASVLTTVACYAYPQRVLGAGLRFLVAVGGLLPHRFPCGGGALRGGKLRHALVEFQLSPHAHPRVGACTPHMSQLSWPE